MAADDAIARYLGNTAAAPRNTSGPPDDRAPAPPPAAPPAGGGGSSGGGTGTGPTPDWTAYLSNWGFDTSIVNELDRIFRTYTDPSQAALAGLAYIRGTQWYAATFPGIQQGMALGVVGNEQDYRSYVNQINQYYRSFYNRDVSGKEVSGYLQAGYTPQFVQRQFQAQGYRTSMQANLSDVFNESELTTLANQEAGIDSPTGQRLLALAQKFEELSPIYRTYGVVMDRGMLEQSYAGNVSGPQVTNQLQAQGFRNALPSNMASIFSSSELQSIANAQAGVPDTNGQKLLGLASKYEELAPVYAQYGRQLDRATVEGAFNNNLSAETVGRQFQGGAYVAANANDIQYTLGAFGNGAASAADLKALGNESAGLDSQLGQEISRRLDMAKQRIQTLLGGTLATPGVTLGSRGLKAPGLSGTRQTPDVAA